MNDQQLSQIEQRIERNEILLDQPPSDTFKFKYNAAKRTALLQSNDDLRILINEVKMSKSFRVVLTDELHRKCKMKSAATGKTITNVCREALTDWVDKQHPIILPPEHQPTGKIVPS